MSTSVGQVSPSNVTPFNRPPSRSELSRSVTSCRSLASRAAAESPANPPPTTRTRAMAGSPDLGREATSEDDQLVIGRGEHRVRVSGRRPDLVGARPTPRRSAYAGEQGARPARLRRWPDRCGRARTPAWRASTAAGRGGSATRSTSTRCDPDVRIRTGCPAESNTRLLTIAPISTSSARAASAAVLAESGSTRTVPRAPSPCNVWVTWSTPG